MKNLRNYFMLFAVYSLFIGGCTAQTQVITGAEQTEEYLPLIANERIAVVANQTSRIGNSHLVDSLLRLGVDIAHVFAPEHGFRGKADAGAHIADHKDTKSGLAVISLYGRSKKPTKKDLQDVDRVIFDIQDVGARFYTYISSLHYVMEACAEQDIPLLILDRPNPNGHYVDGPVLDTAFSSFVGMHPVPVVHGMTMGEYARMINGEGWLKNGIHCELRIITCSNYTHQTPYKLPVPPSPNLPNQRAIQLYPSLCFFEGNSLSIGRGTHMQFQVIGHPALAGRDLFSFTPTPNQGARHPKHAHKTCYGYDLRKPDTWLKESDSSLNLQFLIQAYRHFPDSLAFFSRPAFFDKLAGSSQLRKQIISGTDTHTIRESWKADLDRFKTTRKKYLCYAD